jgi:UDP-2,4-diacetamido-2,4,6-trideoxy-beta-L-altropyranose hydrolase
MKKYGKSSMENKRVIAIRVDSSIEIGSGHVMRCLTLAEQLKSSHTEVFFMCYELTGNIANLIEEKGYVVERFPLLKAAQDEAWKTDLEHTQKILGSLKNQINWLIVDHYGLDSRWERRLRSYTKKIMVIDDLANREHDCDLLLDQNFYLDMKKRYQDLVPQTCKKLLGPQYVLLRPEFYEARKNLRERDGMVRRILIFFGGSDPTNETTKALESIKVLNRPNIAIDVVVGVTNPNKKYIQQLCENLPKTTFYCQVDNMAQLMVNADLAIGAGGATTWERCFLGLPTIVIIVADNQIKVIEAVNKVDAVWSLGMSDTVSSEELVAQILNAINNPKEVRDKAREALSLMECRDNMGIRGFI